MSRNDGYSLTLGDWADTSPRMVESDSITRCGCGCMTSGPMPVVGRWWRRCSEIQDIDFGSR